MLPVILALILAGIAQAQSCPVDSDALMRLWGTVDRETCDYAQQTNSKSHPVGLADGLEHYQTAESHSPHPYSDELVAADTFVRFHPADWERLTSGPGPDSVSSGNSNSASQLDESQEPFETTHDLETMASQVSVPSPPLQIQELIVSGPSSNRVDLVFFSDGCTYMPNDVYSMQWELNLVMLSNRCSRGTQKILRGCYTFGSGYIWKPNVQHRETPA